MAVFAEPGDALLDHLGLLELALRQFGDSGVLVGVTVPSPALGRDRFVLVTVESEEVSVRSLVELSPPRCIFPTRPVA